MFSPFWHISLERLHRSAANDSGLCLGRTLPPFIWALLYPVVVKSVSRLKSLAELYVRTKRTGYACTLGDIPAPPRVYLVKCVETGKARSSPKDDFTIRLISLTCHDEYRHWRLQVDFIQKGRLGSPRPASCPAMST